MKEILQMLAVFCGLWILIGICIEIGFNLGDWLCQ
nr:MAG TPA: protein of unknown function (DUF3980) [Caudoviricetes sp.]